MSRSDFLPVVLLGGLLLVACKPDVEELADAEKAGRACVNTLASPGTRVDWGCIICNDPKNLRRAVDGNESSYGQLPFVATPSGSVNGPATGTILARAIAKEGITIPAGHKVGGLFYLPPGAAQVQSVVVKTYLNSLPQETYSGSSSLNGIGGGGKSLLTYSTLLPFDEVELQFNITNEDPDRVESVVRLYEFCS